MTYADCFPREALWAFHDSLMAEFPDIAWRVFMFLWHAWAVRCAIG
jgi:hypothetical protein